MHRSAIRNRCLRKKFPHVVHNTFGNTAVYISIAFSLLTTYYSMTFKPFFDKQPEMCKAYNSAAIV
jgi:hypothetical protein